MGLLDKKIVKKLNCLSRFVVLTQEDRVLWTELDNVEIIPNPIAFVPSVFPLVLIIM